ncbi:glycohydrolase toxin TNT-related protein [Amycolatopsis sp.]|uniref:glycohydrolase toxin TNT-related protein n=1 Tax=Amycolatopsis sp. TaxID=37632 RepID=UPI002CD1D925|nr:glycohydrolase toxin TNT-related protein [Amycolatopsis sp.]HVV14188.1 glycohydrolase toxin TNT-related protein [Amycolatopsis sp.]
MAQATTQLNATEQDTLVKQIGLALLRAAPRDWRRVTAQYRAVGRYHELTGEVLNEDGSVSEWMATHDIATLFGRLRGGMYREGRGTWFNARYQLDHPSSYNLEYDRDEPRWDLQPPPVAYADELRMFPRSEENVPEWLIRRMSGLGPEQPGPRFRIARIFDGQGPDGRPVLNRPELDHDDADRMLEYLNSAPVVLSERGLDLDRLASPPTPKVPVAFHTDGTWIWPAAVNFYLQDYGISPEAELVAHIQSTGFRVPEVPEQVVQAAGAHLTRGNQPPPRRPMPEQAPPPVPPKPEPEPEPVAEETELTQIEEPEPHPGAVDVEQPTTFTPMIDLDDGPPTMVQPPVPAEPEPPAREPEPVQPSPAPQSTQPLQSSQPLPSSQSEAAPATRLVAPEPAASSARMAPPTPPPAPKTAEPAIESLRNRLSDLGVPESRYRIGEPAEHGWSVEQVESGWRVGWYDKELSNPAVFGDAEDAAAFMLGKLLLDHRGRAADLGADQRGEMDVTAPVIGGPSADVVRENRTEIPREAWAEGGHGESTRENLRESGRENWEPVREPRADAGREGWEGAREARGEAQRESWEGGPAHEGRPDAPREGWEGGATRADVAHENWEPGPARDPRAGGPREGWEAPAREGAPQRENARENWEGQPRESGRESWEGAPARENRGDAANAEPPGPELPARPSPEAARPLADQLEATSVDIDGSPTMLAAPVPPPAARREPPVAPPRREPARAAAAPAAAAQQNNGGGAGGQQWPVEPMPGEPPLTLFRGKEMRELPAGSELDRFGNPNGNLTYAAGTPFEERSLVPEWVSRPYHVYRVQRPLEALAGVAIPWFNQPGGGAAYLLPASIEELVAEGDLIELDPGEPPID